MRPRVELGGQSARPTPVNSTWASHYFWRCRFGNYGASPRFQGKNAPALTGPRQAWGHPRPRGSAFGVLPGEVLAKREGAKDHLRPNAIAGQFDPNDAGGASKARSRGRAPEHLKRLETLPHLLPSLDHRPESGCGSGAATQRLDAFPAPLHLLPDLSWGSGYVNGPPCHSKRVSAASCALQRTR